jgi:hypothetical protein
MRLRVRRGDIADTVHPNESDPRARLKAFRDIRDAIERAAERRILAGDYDDESWRKDPATWSIVLTEADLKGR